MRPIRLGLGLALLAGAIFLPAVEEAPAPQVHRIDASGRDRPCDASFATLAGPDRSSVRATALVDDLAYAAADGGPIGLLVLFVAGLLPLLLIGLWSGGVHCGLRRLLLGLGLAAPCGLALLYHSCFLPGRRPVLVGDAALRWVAANLHAQTDRTTGLLGPLDVLRWHRRQGIPVVNISDRNSVEGARRAAAAARRGGELVGLRPPTVALVGEEYHGKPHLVLVHADRSFDPSETGRGEMVRRVQEAGGAVFVAHPWSRMDEALEPLLRDVVDGVEVVNGVIHGGRRVLEAASRTGKALIGSVDFKFGPHVTALTLIPQELAGSRRGVVQAIRDARTEVLYAIPGEPLTGPSWEVSRFGLTAPAAALRALYESGRSRRLVWFGSILLMGLLWNLATRRRPQSPGVGPWRLMLIGSSALQLLLLSLVHWQVRELVGTVPVQLLVAAGAVVAVPLLASAHVLAHIPRP